MHAETATLPAPTAAPESTASTAPRLWPPLALVAVYWAAAVVVGSLDKPYFYGFLYGMASVAVLLLAYFVWWLTRRSLRWRERLLGVFLVVAGGALAAPLVHPSVGGFGLLFTGLPFALSAWTLWMLLARWRNLSLAGVGALVVVWLTWSAFAFIRIDGVSGDLEGDLRWRWTPSAADLFRAELAARGAEAQPAPSSQEPLVADPGDWLAFRGADRQGVVRGVKINTDWDAHPPRQVWRQRVGPAWSSVVVVAGRLFTQEQRDDREAVVCYDAATGNQMWVYEDKARFYESVSGAGPRATPTFADGRLFTLGSTGVLNCLDAATGTRHWSADVAKEADAKAPQWGFSGSPLVVDGLVVVCAGGKAGKDLLAYRAATGEPAWTAAVGQHSYSSPQLAKVAGQPQILLLTEQGMNGVDPATGKILWQHGAAMAGAPRPLQAHAVGEADFMVGTLTGFGVTRFGVTRDGDGWKATERWSTSEAKPEFPDFVVHQGHAYGFDAGIFCCLELETGTRKWKGGRYGRGQVILLADQGVLLVLTEKGQAVLLSASPEKREELGRFQALEGKTWNHPVIAHGKLYARNGEEMACYELNVKK